MFNLVNVSPESKRNVQNNQFEQIRQSLKQALADPNAKVESLGEKEMDGRTVLGFRFRTGFQGMTVWADPETKFPSRIEATMVGPPETKVVMMNYEFNIELDESLFSIEIPEGYTVIEADVDASMPTEAEFIASLKVCSEHNDGKFPDGLDTVAISKHIAKILLAKGDGTGKPSEELLKETMKIGRGIRFALTLPPESDAHFAGAGVSLGEENMPIFWYRPTDGDTYRVIFADLTVKDEDAAPDIEDAIKLIP